MGTTEPPRDRPVAPGLRPYVSSLVAYDVSFDGPGVHRGLPTTTVTFVLPLDEPLEVSWAADPATRRVSWSSLSGLHGAPAAIHHRGHQRGLQLALTTAGARALLGVPAAALAGELLTLDEVVPGLAWLPERLAAEPSWERRQRLLERGLLDALARHGEARPRAEVGRALAQLTRGRPVHEVATEVGFSRRRLSTLVRDECGLSPKQYQRIARFQASRNLLGRACTVADVAHRAGYADQSHLAREWVDLAGCTPTTWLREEFPFIQDPAEDDAPR